MCPDGTFLFNNYCWSTDAVIFSGSATLTVLGGLIGWLSRIWFENRKRKQIITDRRNEYQRLAAEHSLSWIDPMNLALIRVESVGSAYLFGRVDEKHFIDRWPKNLALDLEDLDLPVHLRPYLPDDVQNMGLRILSKFQELYYSIREIDRKDLGGVYLKLGEIFELGAEINELRILLEEAHQRTLD